MSLGDRIKRFAQDFPGQGATVATGLFLILAFGSVVVVRFALGLVFPEGYDGWLWFLGGLVGVSTAGMVGKRLTDRELARIKAGGPSTTVNADTANVTGGPVEVKPPGNEGG